MAGPSSTGPAWKRIELGRCRWAALGLLDPARQRGQRLDLAPVPDVAGVHHGRLILAAIEGTTWAPADSRSMAAADESVLVQMFDQAASAGAATTDRTTGSDCDGSRFHRGLSSRRRSLNLDLKGSGAGGGSRSTDHFYFTDFATRCIEVRLSTGPVP